MMVNIQEYVSLSFIFIKTNQTLVFVFCNLDIYNKTCTFQYDDTGSRINFDTFQFDLDQFCVDFFLK